MLDSVWDRGDATAARAARRRVSKSQRELCSSAVRAVALVIVAALAAPAAAQAGHPRIGGFLPVDAAKRFQKRYFPPEAPKLLRDKRATFFHTKRPIWVGRCRRINRPTVTCRFSLKLLPDKAHRKKHWAPIRCRGRVRSRHRTNGSIVGDVRNYRCRTIAP
jgi:hypothetical protein